MTCASYSRVRNEVLENVIAMLVLEHASHSLSYPTVVLLLQMKAVVSRNSCNTQYYIEVWWGHNRGLSDNYILSYYRR